jgi:hypothetical protein
MSTDNRILTDPKHQTNDEWLQGYSNTSGDGQPRLVAVSPENPSHDASSLQGEFAYQEHRTTKNGRVVLEFAHMETGVVALRFFNVDVKKYRTGSHGQFTTYPRHKFRKFWQHMVGCPPAKWCRVHQEMHKLKDLRFRGHATYRTTDKGGYWNLEKVRKL